MNQKYLDEPLPMSIIEILRTREAAWQYETLIKAYPRLEALSETLRTPVRDWE